MKFIRIIVSVLALLITLGILAVFLLTFFLDPNRLKSVIADTLKQETGYNIIIDGPCSWSFYPYLGVTVAHISFAMPGRAEYFADLTKVTFITSIADSIPKLSALLHGNFKYNKFYNEIYIDNMRIFDLNLHHAYIGLKWQDKQLFLRPVIAQLYNSELTGYISGSVYGNLSSAVPHYAINAKLSKIKLQSSLIYGTGDASFVLTAQGKTREQILQDLAGNISFNLADGAILNIDLNSLIHNAKLLTTQQSAVIFAIKTAFTRFSGTMKVNHGIAFTDNILLLSPNFTVHGNGNINLLSNIIAMQLAVDAARLAIPVIVSGNIFNPIVRLDTTKFNIDLAKEKIDAVINRIGDKVKEIIRGASKSAPIVSPAQKVIQL